MEDATTEGKVNELSVRPASLEDVSSKSKLAPKEGGIPLDFLYFPSADGIDENLLILLHGLGDTHMPFVKLGRSLKLPQTAVLALKAPLQIPYLYEDAFQWYPSFDDLGEMLSNPNPTIAIEALAVTLRYLIASCNWPPKSINIFGFAQGGTVAVEAALRWWITSAERDHERALGSVVTVSGPLLSYPTTNVTCPSPVLVFRRTREEGSMADSDVRTLKRGFQDVREVKIGSGEGMPRAKDEWEPIMRFWSERLQRRMIGAGSGPVYEVVAA